MHNPFSIPRPHTISGQLIENGWTFDEFLECENLRSRLQDSAEWLCYKDRSSREIYSALFSQIDPWNSRMKDGVNCINELMWELGYRPTGDPLNRMNPVWRWDEASQTARGDALK